MDTVYQTLQEQFLIHRPRRIRCQTRFLKGLEGRTELTTCLCDIAQLFVFVQIRFLQSVDKLSNGFVTAVIRQIIHLDLQTVQQTYCIVDRVGLVGEGCIFCFVTVAAGDHRQYGK